MGYLIALGLLAAFSAAVLNPYGRRLLATMFLVVCAIGMTWYVLYRINNPDNPAAQSSAKAGMTDAELFAGPASDTPGAVHGADNSAPQSAPAKRAAYCAGHHEETSPPDLMAIGYGCFDPKSHSAQKTVAEKSDVCKDQHDPPDAFDVAFCGLPHLKESGLIRRPPTVRFL